MPYDEGIGFFYCFYILIIKICVDKPVDKYVDKPWKSIL